MLHPCSLDFPKPILANFPFLNHSFPFLILSLLSAGDCEGELHVDGLCGISCCIPMELGCRWSPCWKPEVGPELRASVLICASHDPSVSDPWWMKLLRVVSVLKLDEGSNVRFFIHSETLNCFTTTPHEPLLYLAYSSTRYRFSVLKENLKMKTMQGEIYGLCYHRARQWGPYELKSVCTNIQILLFILRVLHQIDSE